MERLELRRGREVIEGTKKSPPAHPFRARGRGLVSFTPGCEVILGPRTVGKESYLSPSNISGFSAANLRVTSSSILGLTASMSE